MHPGITSSFIIRPNKPTHKSYSLIKTKDPFNFIISYTNLSSIMFTLHLHHQENLLADIKNLMVKLHLFTYYSLINYYNLINGSNLSLNLTILYNQPLINILSQPQMIIYSNLKKNLKEQMNTVLHCGLNGHSIKGLIGKLSSH